VETEADGYTVLWYNEETELWENIDGYTASGMIKADLEHFSEYGHIHK
jgi:hypothetical protein